MNFVFIYLFTPCFSYLPAKIMLGKLAGNLPIDDKTKPLLAKCNLSHTCQNKMYIMTVYQKWSYA